MDLGDSILLAIVDKLLVGIVVLIAGLWLNERLEKLKGQLAGARDRIGTTACQRAGQPLEPLATPYAARRRGSDRRCVQGNVQ
jgi:hypothetical protein